MDADLSKQRTSVSAGLVVMELLRPLEKKVTKIFPLVTDKAELPYICYRRGKGDFRQTNSGPRDTVGVEIWIFAKTYEESVDLAEEVRGALDNMRGESESGLTLGSCFLSETEEFWEDDAYIQKMIFELKI